MKSWEIQRLEMMMRTNVLHQNLPWWMMESSTLSTLTGTTSKERKSKMKESVNSKKAHHKVRVSNGASGAMEITELLTLTTRTMHLFIHARTWEVLLKMRMCGSWVERKLLRIHISTSSRKKWKRNFPTTSTTGSSRLFKAQSATRNRKNCEKATILEQMIYKFVLYDSIKELILLI